MTASLAIRPRPSANVTTSSATIVIPQSLVIPMREEIHYFLLEVVDAGVFPALVYCLIIARQGDLDVFNANDESQPR